MPAEISPSGADVHLKELLFCLADDELVLGHRDAEWTGYAPILEEDIAFSNIAQDEMGHALAWYSLLEPITGLTPDQMAFERDAAQFHCCRFVTYPRGDFAYTVVRQFLFDEAERVRLLELTESTNAGVRGVAAKLLPEEQYHLRHTRGLVERLGDATEESHRRMQGALSVAFPQALGMFELLENEDRLVADGVFRGNAPLRTEWIRNILPVLESVALEVPVRKTGESFTIECTPDHGGRRGKHLPQLKHLLDDLQQVYRSIPGATW
jgi:ring-1,2-phenylacetyl-CoA epoxidase subunit PaaC